MKIVWSRSIGWNIDNNVVSGNDGNYYLRWGDKRKKLDYSTIKDGAGCYPWREVFAWWPRKTVAGKKVWWEKVYKRRVWIVWGTGFHMEPAVQYATLFEVLSLDHDKNC